MIAFDTNLLIYAHRENSEFHAAAKELVETTRHQSTPWAIPWPCVHEFIGIVTHPGIYKPASTLSEALGFLDALFASRPLQLLSESPGYFEKLKEIATAARLKGPRIHVARIVALCLHHGVNELWSADRDFSCFPNLKVRNPLVKKRSHVTRPPPFHFRSNSPERGRLSRSPPMDQFPSTSSRQHSGPALSKYPATPLGI